MKKVSLSKVKVNKLYQFKCMSNLGSGSGSQCFFNVVGKVKEINGEFVRVFKNNETKQSEKILNRSILEVNELF